MKYSKIFALLMCPMALLSSCGYSDDDPSINTAASVVVSMGQTDISFRESSGIVKVPVKVSGDANGYVTATFEVKEYGENPAMANVHYLMTTQTLTIAPDDEYGYVELKTVDDMEMNDSRFFTITIKDVQGASIGDPATTLVELKDNDQAPYDRLAGEWKMDCMSFSGSAQTLTVKLNPYDDGDLGYNHSYTMTEFGGGDTTIDVAFSYNEASETGNITINLGQEIGTYNGSTIFLYGLTDDGYIQTSGQLKFEWNEDFTELNIVGEPGSMAALFNNDGWYIYETALNITSLYRAK